MGDSRESIRNWNPYFIARQADSHESLEFPIRANHAKNIRAIHATKLQTFGRFPYQPADTHNLERKRQRGGGRLRRKEVEQSVTRTSLYSPRMEKDMNMVGREGGQREGEREREKKKKEKERERGRI